MKRVGIIDLGSNTTRLIVLAYVPGHSFKLTDEVSEVVRLAEGVSADGELHALPMRRAIEALKLFHTFCRASGVQEIIAVATSALRDASNQQPFLEAVQREAGLELRILSGEEEAYYGYMGVMHSLLVTNGYVFDIGGGSTEVTEIYRRSFSRFFSQPAGAVRFSERYVQSDPISKQDFRTLQQAAAAIFADADWVRALPEHTLVGIGGTVRNLARIDQKRSRYPLGRVHGYVLTRTALERIISLLRRSTLAERQAIAGLNRDRADVILAGAVIVQQLMEYSGFEELTVGGAGLRVGLFYEHFLSQQPAPPLHDVRSFTVHNLARLCDYEEVHANRVCALSLSMFDQLRALHGYGAWERELLGYAALLHDIGVVVGYYDHHKHSSYLVLNATLNGFSHREIALLAMLVRIHRKGSIDTREFAAVLADDDGERVARLGALLRIAEYLERSKAQVVRDVRVRVGEGEEGGDGEGHTRVQIQVEAEGDATVELWAANRRSNLFQSAFGCAVEIVEATRK